MYKKNNKEGDTTGKEEKCKRINIKISYTVVLCLSDSCIPPEKFHNFSCKLVKTSEKRVKGMMVFLSIFHMSTH